MKNTHNHDASILDNLSLRTRNALEALIRSPIAEKAIEQAEAEQLNQRRVLVTQLAAAEAAYPAGKSKCLADCERAARAFEKAEQAFISAKAELETARALDHGHEISYLNKRREVTDQLMDSSDPRLAGFIAIAEGFLSVDLVVSLLFWVESKKVGLLGAKEHRQCSNMELIEAAKAAIKGVIAQAKAVQLEAASYAEVSQALSGWCADLAKPLGKLELNPPSLTAEHAEVGRPLKWQGRSTWVVDRLPVVTAEDRLAKAEDDKVKAEQEG